MVRLSLFFFFLSLFFLFPLFQSFEQWVPPVLRLLFLNNGGLYVLRLTLLDNTNCPKAYFV